MCHNTIRIGQPHISHFLPAESIKGPKSHHSFYMTSLCQYLEMHEVYEQQLCVLSRSGYIIHSGMVIYHSRTVDAVVLLLTIGNCCIISLKVSAITNIPYSICILATVHTFDGIHIKGYIHFCCAKHKDTYCGGGEHVRTKLNIVV